MKGVLGGVGGSLERCQPSFQDLRAFFLGFPGLRPGLNSGRPIRDSKGD